MLFTICSTWALLSVLTGATWWPSKTAGVGLALGWQDAIIVANTGFRFGIPEPKKCNIMESWWSPGFFAVGRGRSKFLLRGMLAGHRQDDMKDTCVGHKESRLLNLYFCHA